MRQVSFIPPNETVEERQARLVAEELSDWRTVLQNPAGRRVLLGILCDCNLFQSHWDPTPAIHKNEGMRIVGLKILEKVKAADRHAFPTMLAEASALEHREELAREAARKTSIGEDVD